MTAGAVTNNGKLLVRLDERTQRIEDKLDGYCDRADKQHDDHEQRLRDLEAGRGWAVFRDVGAYVMAIAAGVAAGLSGQK
jgi:hypothetical protein